MQQKQNGRKDISLPLPFNFAVMTILDFLKVL